MLQHNRFLRVSLQQPDVWPRPAAPGALGAVLASPAGMSNATLDALLLSLQIADPGDLEAVRADKCGQGFS